MMKNKQRNHILILHKIMKKPEPQLKKKVCTIKITRQSNGTRIIISKVCIGMVTTKDLKTDTRKVMKMVNGMGCIIHR